MDNLDLLNFRRLEKEDYDKNYLELLKQLTTVGDISKEKYETTFDKMGAEVWVVEFEGKIIASVSLLLEQKMIHECGIVGHLEDVVVDKDYRKYGLGKFIIERIIKIARERGCYKLIGDCKSELLGFYEKNGFESKCVQISIYF
jgi:glucosamine-phosphate N-acetyltransferase